MRLVYAHFPINPVIGAGGKDVEIRNFCKSGFDCSGRDVALNPAFSSHA